ncbi:MULTISPECIES: ABC transporter permease subunit [unclassified Halomonas]|uniref:ABC transporter permease n=1 Tax=unclassified Halomonas TaxID=2609666 RepID=UPI0009ECD66E|nr:MULTISPECIES: ABC transporter permease subunit [unclassified Halomonas]MBT2786887.1 ABC transporter permease subunit [Halomonas sp. ISL-106]MBT2798460.1 ABC transporter permease subunit [Halomonas sp. ISL-104]
MLLRLAPWLLISVLVVPLAAGLLMVILPAFGYLPVLGSETFHLEAWYDLWQRPGLHRSILLSYASGLITTLVALSIVVLFLAASRGTWLDRGIRRLVSPLLAIPHAAVAFGLAFLIAPSGLVVRWFSPGLTGWERPPDLLIVNDPMGLALMAGLVLKEVPFLLLMCLAALPQLDTEKRVTLARSLGYSANIAWLKSVLPVLYPLIRLPVYAVIAYATSVVDMAMILGPTLPPTLSVSILGWFNDPDLERRYMASAGAVLQLGVSLAALLTWWLGEQCVKWVSQSWLVNGSRNTGSIAIAIGGRVLLATSTLLAISAIGGLVIFSMAGFWRFPDALPGTFTLDHWQRILPSVTTPLLNTLSVGLAATLIAAVLVVATLENAVRHHLPVSRSQWLLYLPLIVPQVAFLFGLVVAAESISVRPQLALVVAAHLLFVAPYLYLSLSEAYRRLDPRWVQVAHSLGVGPWRAFWRVRLPLLLAPLLTACAVSLAVSIGQYLPTLLLGGGRVPTITTEAVAMASGGNRRLIAVLALLQALLPFIGFSLALLVPRLVWAKRRNMRGVV